MPGIEEVSLRVNGPLLRLDKLRIYKFFRQSPLLIPSKTVTFCRTRLIAIMLLTLFTTIIGLKIILTVIDYRTGIFLVQQQVCYLEPHSSLIYSKIIPHWVRFESLINLSILW